MAMTEDSENRNQLNNETEPEEKPNLITSFSPIGAAFLGLITVFILYQLGGAVLTLAIFGLNFKDADINAMRLFTMGGQILFILLPALIFTKFVFLDVTSALRIKLPKAQEVAVFIIGLIILTPLLLSFIYLQNYAFTKLAENISLFDTMKNLLDELDKVVESAYGDLLRANSFFEGSFIVFIVAVVPAICEEVFFRGFVQKSFEQKIKPFWAALITATFFGIYHFNPYGLIALIALGVFFGFAAYISESIFIPIVLHFTNNFFSVLVYLLVGDKDLISSSATKNENILPYLISFAVLSIIFFSFILFVKRNYKKIKGGINDLS